MHERIGSARNDEQCRVERWVHDHGARLRGYLRAMTGNADAADDLLQEVFCRAWQHRERYQEQGSERAYLFRVADRLVRDYRRGHRETQILMDDQIAGSQASPEAPMEAVEVSDQLRQSMNALTENQRRTLLLRFYTEMSFAEIAEILDCPLNTVLSHCRRGLQTLRSLMAEAMP